MVVVLILGILIAVGTPSLLGARERAWDASARSSLRTAASNAIIASDFRSDFTLASVSSLTAAEPSLTYVAAGETSTGPKIVSVDATSSGRWAAAVMSESGTCFSVVVGPHGQVSPEADECAASLITDSPPGPPATPYSGTQTYAGWAEAVTTGMCLEVIGGFVEQQPCSQAQADIRIHTRDDGYSTVSITDGRCFGTEGPFVAARVSEEECDETPDQLWLIIEAIGGRVQLKNAETGWCMDIYGNSSSAGARLIQWGYGSSPNGTCKPSDQKNNQTFYLGQ